MAGLQTLMRAITRGGTSLTAGTEVTLQTDESKNVLVAQGGALYSEMARAGGLWNMISGAATPLVVIPTTLTILEIYNNSLAIGQPMTMEILDCFILELLGTAAVHAVSVWAQVTAPKAAPSTGSLVVGSQSGRTKYTDTALTRVISGAGTTVVANGWRPWGNPNPGATATATPMGAHAAQVQGQLQVPPGCSLCVTALDALATASSVQVGAAWNERAMTATIAIG